MGKFSNAFIRRLEARKKVFEIAEIIKTSLLQNIGWFQKYSLFDLDFLISEIVLNKLKDL